MPSRPKAPRRIIPHPLDASLALVPLADTGKTAVIDVCFVAEVQRYHWYFQAGAYAHGNLPGSSRRIGLHVLVWRLAGRNGKDVVDHINRSPLDCRLENLRAAEFAQNSWNAAYPRNRTGFTGVCREGQSDRFRASICVRGKRHIAYGFTSALLASEWRDRMAESLRGEFAVPSSEVKH